MLYGYTYGWNKPGYNFCGPGNSLDHMPTSAIDEICQNHDIAYENPNSSEKDDDEVFLTNISQYAKENAAEKNVVIFFIQSIFKLKKWVPYNFKLKKWVLFLKVSRGEFK